MAGFGRWIRVAVWAVVAGWLAGCSGTTARVQHRDAAIEPRPQALTPGSLQAIEVESKVGTFDSAAERDNYAASLRSVMQAANLFGGDPTMPYTLHVTIVDFDIPKASFSGFDSTLDTRYELRDAAGRVVFGEQISTGGSDDTGSFFGPLRQNRSRTVAVANNLRAFVQRLGVRLQQRAAAAAAALSTASAGPAAAPSARPEPAGVTAGVTAGPPTPGGALTQAAARPNPVAPRTTATPDLAPVDLKPLRVDGAIDFGRYHALIVGNNAYQHIPPLKSAIGDAQRLDHILRESYGFQTRLLVDARRDQIVSALNDYRRTLGPQDNLLIYYAGHGWVDEQADEGYWLPIDAQSDDPARWLSNATLATTLRAIPARHVLVIADSCFAGKLTRGARVQLPTQDYLRRLMAKRARTALTSGGLEPVLDSGGKGNHSVFASALFDVLEGNTGAMDMTQMFHAIRREVALQAEQFPEYGDIRRAGHDGGDFVFVRRTGP